MRPLAFEEPWSAAMMRVLETQGYRASVGSAYVASRLGLDIEKAEGILAALATAGVARTEGDRYARGEPLTVDTQASPEDVRTLRAHWASAGFKNRAQRTGSGST